MEQNAKRIGGRRKHLGATDMGGLEKDGSADDEAVVREDRRSRLVVQQVGEQEAKEEEES